MNTEEALEYIGQQARKHNVDQFDAIVLQSEDFSVEVFQHQVKGTELSFTQGAGIRLFCNGRPGYSYTERLSAPVIEQMVQDAVSLAGMTDPLKINLPSDQTELPQSKIDRYDDDLDKQPVDAFEKFAKDLEDLAYQSGEAIENVPMAAAGRSSSHSWFMNSNGVRFQQKKNRFSAAVEVVASRSGQKKSAYGYDSAPSWGSIDPAELAERAYLRSSGLLGARPIASESLPVILSNKVSGSIFSMFLSAFYAESVQKGQSRLADKLGKVIASDKVSLFIDPLAEDLPGYRVYDSEGVLCQQVPMVEKGVLQTLLYNLESAAQAKVAPTGNGQRGYKGSASTGISNLVFPTGDRDRQAMLDYAPRMLLIEQLEGGAGCSAVSGEISIGVQGHLIEHGKITQAVDSITMNGNFFTLMENIVEASNTYAPEWKSMKVPDLLLSKMDFAG